MFNRKRMSLDDFVIFQRGFDLPVGSFEAGNVPVFGSTSIIGYHNEVRAKAPGVITGRSGTLGTFQYTEIDFWPHNTSLWVKDFKGNNPKFAYYLMQCLNFRDMNSGGAVPTLNRNVLKSFKVDVPDLVIQRKIAAILSAYDDLIENNLKRIKLLEEMAQITYEEWFVRMKFPGHETAQWDKETGLPDGWAKIPLGNMMIFHYGKGLRSHEKREGKVPIYSSAGIFGYHDVSLVDAPGIIVGRKGNVGSVFWSQEPFFPMDTTYYVESKESLYFAYFALKSVEFINNDAAVPGLNRNAAYAMKIISPISELIDRFEEKVKSTFITVFNLKKQNELLREAREILLPRLMTGVIDVDQVEVPEALLARVA